MLFVEPVLWEIALLLPPVISDCSTTMKDLRSSREARNQHAAPSEDDGINKVVYAYLIKIAASAVQSQQAMIEHLTRSR